MVTVAWSLKESPVGAGPPGLAEGLSSANARLGVVEAGTDASRVDTDMSFSNTVSVTFRLTRQRSVEDHQVCPCVGFMSESVPKQTAEFAAEV